ncbi:UNVERIFIED_CONTAM: Subtilisin-like protease SBT4.3 [Sesamum radiatum]|uniref:Subtilisin-like protease SBT4.3 n=1 Tax=Sesamum radiatum TaxID=300843 RepID=A0AAW2RZV2_SESRA
MQGNPCFTTMAAFSPRRFSFLLLVVFVIFCTLQILAAEEDRQVYIVYMGNLVDRDQSPSSYHFSMLQEVVDRRFLRQSLLRSYTRSFNGFAAYLTAEEQEKLARHEEVVSVFPGKTYHPQTTRSWDFMGLAENVHRNPTVESDIIIGVIDTGIWPESESFNDNGFSPPPKKWKGACKGGKNFTCNNKLIGARYYNSHSPTDDSARDKMGHGTHTASTAAGNYVKDASFYGIAKGTARGGVPSARIAAYKVCYPGVGCQEADILAAFDDAIADGVDIITISIGISMPTQFTNDSIAIGAFHASQNGILVVQSAGNKGGQKKTIASVVPWIFTVAASSTDRGIITKAELGNGSILNGKGVNSFSLNGTSYPLAYGADLSRECDKQAAQNCVGGCLENSLVKGKIVLCNTYTGIIEAYRVGAIGSVALSDYITDVSFILPIAASSLHEQDFRLVHSYFGSTKFPKVVILTSESGRNLDAPLVASFSSRGPNTIVPDILKPDVTAPGIEILAAFSPLASPSDNDGDDRSVNYTILSGTSMACPHVAGAAAYVKSFHPNWSTSAIKSALMTTAWRMDSSKVSLAEFSYGAGHIDPVKAVDPGLVYETFTEDYINMLCSMGYATATLRRILGVNNTCPTGVQTTPKDLNYPSMVRRITTNGSTIATFSEKFTRRVTNVGLGNSTYKVTTSKNPDYNISVKPNILTFGALNERKSFEVIIIGKTNGWKMVSAELEWSDGVHRVRSPIVLYPDTL